MRGLAILALLATMGLTTLVVIGPPEPSGVESPGEIVAELRSELGSPGGDDPESGDRGVLVGSEAPVRTSEPAPTFFKYTDDQGRVHFVQSAADVPGRYLESAASHEVRNEIIRPQPSQPARQPSRATAKPARAFGYDAGNEPVRHARGDVVIYTAPWCGWCRKALAWLDARGVDYENRDIEADPDYREELIAKMGSASIPVVEIDGQIVRGYSPGKMKKLLRL